MAAVAALALLAALSAAQPAEPEGGERLAPPDFVTTTPRVSALEAARAAGKLTPRPPKAELKRIWEGGDLVARHRARRHLPVRLQGRFLLRHAGV